MPIPAVCHAQPAPKPSVKTPHKQDCTSNPEEAADRGYNHSTWHPQCHIAARAACFTSHNARDDKVLHELRARGGCSGRREAWDEGG